MVAKISTERAIQETYKISAVLSSWYVQRDSDSVRMQNMRANSLRLVSKTLEELVYAVQPEERLVLTVGHIAAKASQFNKGAYDFYSENAEILEPGRELTFERAEEFGYRGDYQLYVGDYSILIAVASLAKAIQEGSRLAVATPLQ